MGKHTVAYSFGHNVAQVPLARTTRQIVPSADLPPIHPIYICQHQSLVRMP